MSIIVVILSFVISIFAFSQIFGCLFFRLFRKNGIKYLFTILLWVTILALYYIAITNWLNNYFDYYLYSSIAGSIIALFSIRNE